MCSDTELFPGTEDQGKTKMKQLFGVPKLKKDGTIGKVSHFLSFLSASDIITTTERTCPIYDHTPRPGSAI